MIISSLIPNKQCVDSILNQVTCVEQVMFNQVTIQILHFKCMKALVRNMLSM